MKSLVATSTSVSKPNAESRVSEVGGVDDRVVSPQLEAVRNQCLRLREMPLSQVAEVSNNGHGIAI